MTALFQNVPLVPFIGISAAYYKSFQIRNLLIQLKKQVNCCELIESYHSCHSRLHKIDLEDYS